MSQQPQRTEVFEAAAALARAVVTADSRWAWEPLRDLVLSGFEAGGLHYGNDPERLRRAAGEFAAASVDAQRPRQSG